MSELAPEPHARAAPIALWRAMGAFISLLFDLFGAPGEIAASAFLSTRQRALMLRWLRAGEAMLRRLMLIEAAAYVVTPAPPCKPHARVRRLHMFYPDAPQDWRVYFQCVVTRSRKRGARRAGASKRFHDAWPLALRFEALLRAYNDPHARARRLAHRLNAAPARVAALLTAPADEDMLDPDWRTQTLAEAEVAQRRWDTS